MRSGKKKLVTFMIIPHSEKSIYSISLSYSFLKALKYIAAASAFSLVAAGIYFFASYSELKAKNEELSSKVQRYAEVQARLNYYEEKTKSMEQKVKEMEMLDASLRQLLKDDPFLKDKLNKTSSRSLPSELASRSGVDREAALERLEDLELKLEERERSMKELISAIEQRILRLAATPSIWPVQGSITSHFGYRRSPFGKSMEFHDGIDIAAPYGSEVRAAADGRVIFSGYKSGYGYMVEINHGYGHVTAYGHLSKILVREGQYVKKGQTIGRVGSSGRSTGPHVHYMVKVNGSLVDPDEYLD
ncbi:Murein DD-endopeptidase MepM [Fervidicola ferrireducens]|uniref:Murein DD-endopeptidase MepM n=1 Tax=Fervidicola ferrireducens TaxID=520764 RepID=A0A140L766_9FIRM|nr:M23 family metallopeptidase [Fervidicola ferrireducens]KXG76391.1 Murein DD-endopeptidase MepM [Fervidicola ferrireducens]